MSTYKIICNQCGALHKHAFRSRRERELLIEFREGVGFQVNSKSSFLDNSAIFFNDLTNIKAWFGGINESAITDMLVIINYRYQYICVCVC